ncbi:PAS domain S-box protein [Natrinema salinisoli]|uniref:PAS domain-containing sensor histidine kinase n=1 Tax=Natrinema salinisoli TaxID=2878535 RepID=UPI001CF09A97|nr:PAS domain S-box protein [Natrinema salinisoli]
MTSSGRPVVFVGDDPTPSDDLEAAFDVVALADRTAVADYLETTPAACVVVDGSDTDRVATVAAACDAAPSVPIIYTTATADGAAAAAATRAGATEYVVREADETVADRVAAVAPTGDATDAPVPEPGKTPSALEGRSPQRDLEQARPSRERTPERFDDAHFAVDEDFELTAVHGRADDLLTRDGAVGTSLWEAIPDAIGSALETQYRRALAAETMITLEEYAPTLERWLRLRIAPLDGGLSVSVSDTTERHERETDLQRCEAIVETIDDGVLVIDSDQRFVHANDAFADLVGTDAETIVGMHASSFVDDATWNDWMAVAMSLTAGNVSHQTIEAELQRVDGGTVPIEAKVTPLESTDSDDVSFVCVVRDVTERNRRADVVTELLETTQALFSCESREAVADVVVDAAERVLGFEIVTVRFYDPDAEELVLTAASETVSDLFDERKRAGIYESKMGEAFRQSEPIVFDDLRTDSRSTVHDYESFRGAMCIPIGNHGILNVGSAVTGAFDDRHVQLAQLLTASANAALERADRREDLLRHEQVLEAVEGMVYAVDEDTRLTLVTDPLAERLGYDREELLGEPVSLIFDDDSYDRASDRLEDMLSDPQRDRGAFEATYVTADGDRFPVEIECSLLPRSETDIETEAFRGTVSVVRDITRRKEREQYLQVLNRVLRHNLRNDLTVVIGYAELLCDRLEDRDLTAAATTLRETATDLARTSEKTRAIQYALDRDGDLQPVDVAATVEDAIDTVEIGDATISVTTTGDYHAWADPGLELVVDNLLENAVRHTGAAPTVEVTVERDDEGIRLSIDDDGPGIPPAEIAVVTGESDITQLTHSSGLGLWLVRWMVDSYGGSISFARSPLGGSRVDIVLEAAPPESTGATGGDAADAAISEPADGP